MCVFALVLAAVYSDFAPSPFTHTLSHTISLTNTDTRAHTCPHRLTVIHTLVCTGRREGSVPCAENQTRHAQIRIDLPRLARRPGGGQEQGQDLACARGQDCALVPSGALRPFAFCLLRVLSHVCYIYLVLAFCSAWRSCHSHAVVAAVLIF